MRTIKYLLALLMLCSGLKAQLVHQWTVQGIKSTNLSTDESISCMTRDSNGNLYIAGVLNSGTINMEGNLGSFDVSVPSGSNGFFAKYDSLGTVLFVKVIGQTVYPKSICLDTSGNILIGGYFQGTTNDFDPSTNVVTLTPVAGNDVFFAEYDFNGNYVFVKQIGGPNTETLTGIKCDNNNNIYVCGNFNGTTDFDPDAGSTFLVSNGSGDAYFGKYNSSGSLIFVKQIGGTSLDEFSKLDIDSNNDIVLIGSFQGTVDFDPGTSTVSYSTTSQEAFFTKFSSSGNFVYAKPITNGLSTSSNTYSLDIDSNNDIYFAGFYGGQTIDLDPSSAVLNVTDGSCYFVKFSSAGNLIYGKSIGKWSTSAKIFPYSIAVDGSGNLNMTGYFQGSADFDPSSSNQFLVTPGSSDNDIFIARYNNAGDLLFAKQIGSPSTLNENAVAVCISEDGTLNFAGEFSGTADFDVDNVNQNILTSSGGADLFLSQYKQSFFTITTNIIKGSVTCYSDTDGAAAVTPNGNQPPYTYLWSPTGDTDSLVTTLPIGTHTVTVTDGFGLTMSTTITITGPSSALAVSNGSNSPVTCYGGSNGFASVNTSGGGTPYTYNWQPSGNTGSSASNLPAGTQTITVTDSYGCQVSTSVTITEPPQLNLSVVSQLNVSCNGGSNGIATVSATGGSGGNTFSWSPGSYTTTTVSNLTAGNYTVTVFDINGCLAQTTVNITQPAVLTGTVSSLSPVTCFNSNNGAATISANGGTSPYSYSWSPSGGSSNSATNLSAGVYTVTITDNKGCTKDVSVDVQYVAQKQEVCVVTSDSATGTYNIVVWEKPTDLSLIDSFYIYREITTNVYQKLGAKGAHELSEFNDYGADPNSTSYKYYITVLDTCGGESAAGLYHKSIHLQYSGLGNFQWTSYDIENTSNQVSSYNFYRDDNSTGNFAILSVIPGTNNTYSDVNYQSFPNASYRVDVNWISGHICTSTAKYGAGNNQVLGAINTSRSNVKSPSSIGLIDKNLESQYTIGPNPFTNELNIRFAGERKTSIKLYNGLGQCVFEQTIATSTNLHLPELAAGCYIIELNTPNGELRKKLIK